MNKLRSKLYSLISSNKELYEFIENYSAFGLWVFEKSSIQKGLVNRVLEKNLNLKVDDKGTIDLSTCLSGEALDTMYKKVNDFIIDIKPEPQNLALNYKNESYNATYYIYVIDKYVIICFSQLVIEEFTNNSEEKAPAIIEKLKIEKRRLLDIIKGAGIGTWEWNIQTGHVDFNHRWAEMLGYTLHELSPSKVDVWLKLIHPDDIEKTKKALQSHFKNEEELYKVEFRLKHKDGNWIWIHSRGKVVERNEKGEPQLMSGTHYDITARKKQEEELHLFESVIKNMREAVSISSVEPINDTEPEILFVNKSFVEMTGYPEEELVGKTPKILRGPETDEAEIEKISEAVNAKRAFNSELINYRKNGEPFWVNFSATPLANENGNLTHWIAIERDVTIQKAKDELLLKAKEKAEAASNAKSEFLANMSHEIRTPLNSVIGFSELLMQTKLDRVQLDYMQSVNYSAHSLLDLINDILDFSKIEAGKLELNIEKIDLFELLYQVCEIIKFKIDEQHIELLLFIDLEVPQYIWCDQIRLRQILINLLSNAVKFTEEGEIEISVKVEKKDNQEIALKFGIRDTGIGITKTNQKRIFKAFSQEDSSTTRKYGGTGLGLSISNELLALMGSSLNLQSELKIGSHFFFVTSFKYASLNLKNDKPENGISHVLIVDDNERSTEIMTETLKELNVSVENVRNGKDALQFLNSKVELPHAVLIDGEMPEMNGKEVVQKIRRELNLQSDILPLFLMGHQIDGKIKQFLVDEMQLAGFIHKPASRTELIHALTFSEQQLEKEEKTNTEKKIESLNGTSILIVDDNEINRKLAFSMLSTLFSDVTIYEAENGNNAVSIVQKTSIDLILMDVQMPGMSGYEATKSILKIQGLNQYPIIIALTAGIVKGEMERCLEVGMQDYLSKPVTLNKLEAIINKWITKSPNSKKKEQKKGKEKSLKDFNYKSLLEQFGNNKEIIEGILDMIRNGALKQKISELEKKTKDNAEKKQIQLIAHSIKGTALNLCFEKLASLARELEALYPDYEQTRTLKLVENIIESYYLVDKIIHEEKYLN